MAREIESMFQFGDLSIELHQQPETLSLILLPQILPNLLSISSILCSCFAKMKPTHHKTYRLTFFFNDRFHKINYYTSFLGEVPSISSLQIVHDDLIWKYLNLLPLSSEQLSTLKSIKDS